MGAASSPGLAASILPGAEPEGTKPDRIGRNAIIPNPADHPLAARAHCPSVWRWPYTQAEVPACSSRVAAAPWTTIPVERGIMPENVNGLARIGLQLPGLVEGPVKLTEFMIDERLHLGVRGFVFSRSAPGAAHDHARKLDRVSAHGRQRPPQQGLDLVLAIPPGVMVAGGENLRARQAVEPGHVGLHVAMIGAMDRSPGMSTRSPGWTVVLHSASMRVAWSRQVAAYRSRRSGRANER